MSAPVRLTSAQLERLGEFLDGITKVRGETNVNPTAFSNLDVEIDGNSLSVGWDRELEEYVVDDRVGS